MLLDGAGGAGSTEASLTFSDTATEVLDEGEALPSLGEEVQPAELRRARPDGSAGVTGGTDLSVLQERH